MTTSRRDVSQHLYVLDDLATALGRPFATNTRDAFRIIDAVEDYCRTGAWSLDMPSLADLYPTRESSLVWSAITVEQGARLADNPGWVRIWRYAR